MEGRWFAMLGYPSLHSCVMLRSSAAPQGNPTLLLRHTAPAMVMLRPSVALEDDR